MSFPSDTSGDSWNPFAYTSTKKHYRLGTRMVMGDGRVFRYAYNGAVALTPGTLLQAPVTIAAQNKDLVVQAAVAAEATTVKFTNVTTAITKDQFADGMMFVNDADGEGQARRIKSNNAATTTGVCTLQLYEPITTALTTSSEIGLKQNEYNGVILTVATTVTAHVVGVSPIAVPINYYFWLQTAGLAAVLTNGTLVIGNNACIGVTTAGSVDVAADAGILAIVGRVVNVAASTEYSLVDLCISY